MTEKDRIDLKEYMEFRFNTMDKRICEAIQSMKDMVVVCQKNHGEKISIAETRLNAQSAKIRDIELEASKNRGIFSFIGTIASFIWLGFLTWFKG